MRTNDIVKLSVVAAALFGSVASVEATAVSYQFALSYNNGALAPTSSAGLVSVPNWTYTFPANANPSGTFGPLNDSTGTPTTITGSYSASLFNQLGGADSTPNQQLFAGSIGQGYDGDSGSPSNISLAGITYGAYDLIVYVQGRFNGSNIIFTLNGGTPTTGINANSTDSSASPDVTFTPNANYIEFTGLSGSALSLNFTNRDAGGDLASESNAGVSGFQIVDASVAVPEPASLSLLGLAGAGLLLRRRK